MSGQLATSETILVSAAGVIAADSAGLSSVKSYSALLTSIAAMPLAGGTFTGNVLFTDNTYDIGASGATRPRTVYAGTSVITPLLNNTNASALTIGNATYGVLSPGHVVVGTDSIAKNIYIDNRQGAVTWGLYHQSNGTNRVAFDANGSSGEVRIGGLGGSYFPVLYSNGTACLSFTTGGAATFGSTANLKTYTVATLPAAASNAYANANVSDSTVAASGNYGATVAGGGSNKVRVFSDGTNWVIS